MLVIIVLVYYIFHDVFIKKRYKEIIINKILYYLELCSCVTVPMFNNEVQLAVYHLYLTPISMQTQNSLQYLWEWIELIPTEWGDNSLNLA